MGCSETEHLELDEARGRALTSGKSTFATP
ncbi:hypothetical protein CL96_gp127 [Mycobacterium phage Firecracker]|uniref:Uncharacterized protein n=1 Tax=Mycobacterium phage Firecracker TaxID=2922998 RepID=G8I4A9_9CAUD|nr:hypothetical protein CL96_gp127 [Mycobacterium phage Firecracker]AER47553.1 hypothetical protein FIRECRACKER_127 [Mycobacterium phage Firecracker]